MLASLGDEFCVGEIDIKNYNVFMSRNAFHRAKRNEWAYSPNECEQLMKQVDKFFDNQQVQKAMNDLSYRMSEKFRTALCQVKCWPKTVSTMTSPTYIQTADALCLAVNQTQKEIAYAGGFDGMLATSYAHEKLGRFLKGEEFINDMRVVRRIDFADPLIDTQKRVSVFGASALELCETREAIPLQDKEKQSFPITKITHGLQLQLQQFGRSRISNARVKRGYSHGISDERMREIWAYGKGVSDPKTLSDRIQGMDFRHRKLHEFGIRQQSGISLVQSLFLKHTITTEVGGKMAISNGCKPRWFSKVNNPLGEDGPFHPDSHILSFDDQNCDLETQIRRTIDQIAALLYDYPKE